LLEFNGSGTGVSGPMATALLVHWAGTMWRILHCIISVCFSFVSLLGYNTRGPFFIGESDSGRRKGRSRRWMDLDLRDLLL
jgi:hypothetical protein